MTTKPAKRVRCAVYTRVSTEYGLDQEFNSLDAQHEAAEAYVRSQAHDGWTLIRTRYDDGGYSGGSTERPALQRLLADIRDRRIDIVVVYKVDRLTRSLADFAKLVELCVKDVVEERLFAHRRDLLTRLDLVFRHHQPLLRRRRRPDAGPARLQQGSSSRPAADDPRRAARRRWAAGVLGDVAGQHRRRDDTDPGDRPAAGALRHRGCAWSPTAARQSKAAVSDKQPMHLMVEHASLGAAPVKPKAAGGGG
jgi:Resolvase, N terminal domain